MLTNRKRTALLIAIALTLALIAHDLAVPTGHGFGARAALAAIDQYRAHISPRLRGRVNCRFEPSCSAYGRASVAKHGLIVGGAKTAWRIARCNPMTPDGTIDLP
jgi:putative membrane protein insertion efficiency factor